MSTDEYLRVMLEQRARYVHATFPEQATILAYAIARVRREGIPLEEASALTIDRDGALLHEGERILGIFCIADKDATSDVTDLEALAAKILDPG